MIRNIRVDTMKLRNKNYKQNHSVSIAQIKSNSKRSFQQLVQDSPQYDHYINSIYQRMMKEQEESPALVIPKHFEAFLKSKLFKQLLHAIFQYMSLLEQHSQTYTKHAAEHPLSQGTLMIHQAEQLQLKFKEVSYAYMGVLLSHGEAKFIFKDQYFFETMIYFLSQILKENFEQSVYPTIDSELNRIFRTNTFNLIKRRYQEDQLIQEYPQLQDRRYSATAQGGKDLIQRLTTHKHFHYAMQIRPKLTPSLTKPLDISQSASKSIHSRSPLIASYFPSPRERLFNFSRQHSVRDKIVTSMARNRSFSSRK